MPTLAPTGFAPARTGGTGMFYGYREDFSKDALTLLDPHDAYFTKKCARESINALSVDWLTDNLPALSTTLRTPKYLDEGWSNSTTVARKRFFNQVEYLDWSWSIAQAAEIIAKKGGIAGGISSEIASEIERQMKYAGKEIEQLCLSAQAAVVDASTTPGKLSGFFDAAKWNAFTASTPPLKWNAKLAADINAFNAIGQTDLEDVLLAMYQNGAIGPLSAYMPSAVQAAWAANFTGRPGYQVTQAVGEHAIDNQVYTYWSRTGIGQVDFIADRTLDGLGCVALINHNYIKIGELNPIAVWEIDPNNQRNRAGVIDTYLTLMDKNPQAHGRIYTTGVTPS